MKECRGKEIERANTNFIISKGQNTKYEIMLCKCWCFLNEAEKLR